MTKYAVIQLVERKYFKQRDIRGNSHQYRRLQIIWFNISTQIGCLLKTRISTFNILQKPNLKKPSTTICQILLSQF